MSYTAEQISGWRDGWIEQMLQHSQHPLIFWQAVAHRLITDRLRLRCDPLAPLGPNGTDAMRCFEMLAERNLQGLHLERVNELPKALILYEACVADCFSGLSPYERLRTIYTRWGWYEDALRVCEAYDVQPEQPGMDSHEYFRSCADWLAKQLRQQKKSKDGGL